MQRTLGGEVRNDVVLASTQSLHCTSLSHREVDRAIDFRDILHCAPTGTGAARWVLLNCAAACSMRDLVRAHTHNT